MADIIKNFVLTKWTVYLWALIALALGVGGFFCPPMGQIDGSVLTFVGELFCAPLLVSVIDGIHEGRKTMIRKGDLEVTIEDQKE